MLVVCNGMLRSGSTLQYSFVRTLLEITSRGIGAGHAEPSSIDDAQLARWIESDTITVIKMHNIDSRIVSSLAEEKVAVCYIYRDIRHVAASMRRKWNPLWPELIKSLDQAVASFETLTAIPGVLVQRYESVLADQVGSVQQIANHLRIELGQRDLDEVVRLCSPASVHELASGFTVRQKISHSINSFGQRLPSRIRLALHRSGVVSTARRLGVSQSVYDKRTLLHPEHITSGSLQVSGQFCDLSEVEMSELADRYASFFQQGNYVI